MSEDNYNHPFVLAAKAQLRFVGPNGGGQLTVDDLFTLSLKDLDKMGLAIKETISDSSASLLTNPDTQVSAVTKEQTLRLEVIKTVIGVKEADNSAKAQAAKKAKRREFLLGLRKKKELDELSELSTEDIDKELAELDS